jgi:hypothetical protein
MNQETKNKFAEILAAQQAKANNIQTIKPLVKDHPKEYNNLKEIERAAKSGETISLLNMANLVKSEKKQSEPEAIKPEPVKIESIAPELSNLTVSDLLNESTATETALNLIDYSEKAFCITGQTKPIKEQLKQLGGRFNMYLTCGPGWIFPKTRIDLVKKELNLIY